MNLWSDATGEAVSNNSCHKTYKVLARADETGYICHFQIYTGKVGDITDKNSTWGFIGKGHHVYIDNYFDSVAFQKQLQKELVHARGTVKRGRI